MAEQLTDEFLDEFDDIEIIDEGDDFYPKGEGSTEVTETDWRTMAIDLCNAAGANLDATAPDDAIIDAASTIVEGAEAPDTPYDYIDTEFEAPYDEIEPQSFADVATGAEDFVGGVGGEF